MRFTADGPEIPDSLLIARDRGDVIFFCGAGVSQANAHLPNFEGLGRRVVQILGSAKDSPARTLLEKAVALGTMVGVGGLLATDRVFGLLEREFDVAEVRAAIAGAIRPPVGYQLDAHRILLDLAKTPSGTTRLVTTNFDLLFEECDPKLISSGPPQLPNPRSERDFRGIIHLHGRVDTTYSHPADDEFVVSSADFGRAYLSDGWATQFIQALMARYQIVFLGYSADDPPVQYLLEALNLHPGSRNQLFAFQAGERGEAAALWEHRGVQAIPFDPSNGYVNLWETLRAWAERARQVDHWYSALLEKACSSPESLTPYVRGQIAHLAGTREGARRIATASVPIHPNWLLVFDASQRYGLAGSFLLDDDVEQRPSPFDQLHLDSDIPIDKTTRPRRSTAAAVPENSWDAFAITRLDHEQSTEGSLSPLRGSFAGMASGLPPRLSSLAAWIQRVAHLPVTLWWAAQQGDLHPEIKQGIAFSLDRSPKLFSEAVSQGWRQLLASWADKRPRPDGPKFAIQRRVKESGWAPRDVREFVGLYRAQLKTEPGFHCEHPLSWKDGLPDSDFVRTDVQYPHPHSGLHIPDHLVAYAIGQFLGNFEWAIDIEKETSGSERLHFETTRPDDGSDLEHDSHGLHLAIVLFQKLMDRWAKFDPRSASDEVKRWSQSDEYIFARLRIWSAGQRWLPANDCGAIFLSLSDRVFWGSLHQRDLLYALRDRWAALPLSIRRALEDRLRSGAYPWRDDAKRPEHAAHDRMSRLHWLSSQGVVFDFDVKAELQSLLRHAPGWTSKAGDEAAVSNAPEAFFVSSDESIEPLTHVPVSQVLDRMRELAGFDILSRVEREPFRGLSKSRPARALAVLTDASRKGVMPEAAWSDFLRADSRVTDSLRMTRAIAQRLCRLPLAHFKTIAYPVSEWMLAITSRLYSDASTEFEALWERMLEALRLYSHDQLPAEGWGDRALNAPVGKLSDLLLKDPAVANVVGGGDFPIYWKRRVEQVVDLPGDLRCQALVMFTFHIRWFHFIAPKWTERMLIPSADNEGNEGEAFWDGVLWQAKSPSRALLGKLKSGLTKRACRPRSRHVQGNVIAAFLLSAWLYDANLANVEKVMSDDDLREVLIHADDDLRGQFIWHLEQMLTSEQGALRKHIVPFLRQVWPRQRAARTPSNSAKLANLALMSGDLTPSVVDAILPRLVPVRDATLRATVTIDGDHLNPAQTYARPILDLLWAILGEDSRQWPYNIEVLLDQLDQETSTKDDPRLSELRRRRER